MKMSKILRVISQIIFWCAAVYLFADITKVANCEGWLFLMTLLTVAATNFARMVKNKFLTFVCHLLSVGICGFFVVTNLIPVVIIFFAIILVALSVIAAWAEADFMDRPHGFGQFVLLITYIVGAIMNYDKLWLHFILFVFYVFLVFAERNVRNSEEYIHGVSYTSVMDIKKMHNVSNTITMGISFVVILLSTAFAMIAKISPVAAFGNMIFSKLRQLFSFLKKFNIDLGGMNQVDQNEVDVDDSLIMGGDAQGTPQEKLPVTSTDRVVVVILVIVTVLCALIGIYLMMRGLYKKYLMSQREGVDEKSIALAKTKKKKHENPKKTDASYSNRKAVRKIYKKRVKGKSGRREDFYNYTPTEQINKSLAEGNDVSEEMIEIYEKARYSKEEITKDDVRIIKEI